MNFCRYFLFRNLFFFYLLISSVWLASCGLRTAPSNLPEIKQKSTFSDFKIQQRGALLRLSWVINEKKGSAPLKEFVEVPEMQEYFLLQESKIPLDCLACDSVELPPLRLLFSSKSIIREENRLYYYSALPENELNLQQFELSHFGPDDEIMSPGKIVKFRQNKLFPKVPAPNFKIVQIEDDKQTVRFAFGKVVLTKTTILEDDAVKLKQQKKKETDSLEFNLPDKQPQTSARTFIMRLSWPQIADKGLKRLQGQGSYFAEQHNFKVNLYRIRSGENWSETPINSKSSQDNYFLDKLKLHIPHASRQQLKDVQPDKSSAKLPFYVDLRGQNGDTWLYQLRLVDRFGNESSASETITVYLPKIKINGQSFSKNVDVPPAD
jgi:hypothetical protein